MDCQWVWSRQSASAKLRTMKFSSEGLGGNSAKFCTSENFRYTVLHVFEGGYYLRLFSVRSKCSYYLKMATIWGMAHLYHNCSVTIIVYYILMEKSANS